MSEELHEEDPDAEYYVHNSVARRLDDEITTLRAENAALFLQLNEQLERADSLAHSVIELENKLVAQSASLLALQQAVAVYREALTLLLERYVGLVNSGDAGNWNPEQEFEVRNARSALSLSPDSTLMGRVVEVLEMADVESLFTISKLGATVSTGGLIQLREKATAILAELKQPQI